MDHRAQRTSAGTTLDEGADVAIPPQPPLTTTPLEGGELGVAVIPHCPDAFQMIKAPMIMSAAAANPHPGESGSHMLILSPLNVGT
jgi:hypothetical protein